MELEIYDELQSAQLAMRGDVEQVKVEIAKVERKAIWSNGWLQRLCLSSGQSRR